MSCYIRREEKRPAKKPTGNRGGLPPYYTLGTTGRQGLALFQTGTSKDAPNVSGKGLIGGRGGASSRVASFKGYGDSGGGPGGGDKTQRRKKTHLRKG